MHGEESCRQSDRHHAKEEPVGPLYVNRLLDKEVKLRSDHDCHDQADCEAEDRGSHHHHEGFIHEDASTLYLSQTNRAKHPVLPDRLIDVLLRADEQEEEGDDEGDDRDDRHEDLEDDFEGLEAILHDTSLHHDHSSIGEHVSDPVHDLSFLLGRDVRVQLDEALLFGNAIDTAILFRLSYESLMPIWLLLPGIVK